MPGKWDLLKLKKLVHSKVKTILKKTEKTTWETGESGCNNAADKGFMSKIYKRLTQLGKKNQQPNRKTGRRPKQTFLQRRHIDGQQAHEKMLNFPNYQRNANQNYKDLPPRAGQNSLH